MTSFVKKGHEAESTVRYVVVAAAALIVGLFVQVSQARLVGGWSALIAVGETSPVRDLISQQLPELVLLDGVGHDGQAAYAVGLDPWLQGPPPAIEDLSYRYRRIALPLLGSGFGLFDGELLLYMLTGISLLAFVATVLAVAMIANCRSLPSAVVLAGMVNIGLWLSLQNTTPDVLAMGLSMLGLALFLRNHHLAAIALLAAGTLAKETYFLIPAALATWSWRIQREPRVAMGYLSSGIPLAIWSLYLIGRLGDRDASGVILAWPLQGLMEAPIIWESAGGRDLLFTVLTMASLAVATWAVFRSQSALWRLLLIPWIALALLSSHWVWDLGNNSLRVFAPLVTLVPLALLDQRPSIRGQRPQLMTLR
jgi:hypothetical protein